MVGKEHQFAGKDLAEISKGAFHEDVVSSPEHQNRDLIYKGNDMYLGQPLIVPPVPSRVELRRETIPYDDVKPKVNASTLGEDMASQARVSLEGSTAERNKKYLEIYPALSERERRLLTLVSEGKGDQEIANALSIGLSTTKAKLGVIFRVLGISSRVQAAIIHHTWTELHSDEKEKLATAYGEAAHLETQPMSKSLASIREREVAALLHDGLTNKEIGQKLGISANTVKNHLTSLYEKYNVSNRTELVAKLYQPDEEKK